VDEAVELAGGTSAEAVSIAEGVDLREPGADAWAGDDDGSPRVRTGWAGVDGAIGGGLRRGVLHEWYGEIGPTTRVQHGGDEPTLSDRHPALGLMGVLLARAACDAADAGGLIVMVGSAARVHGAALADVTAGRGESARSVLARCVYVDARTLAERVWALELCLRSPAVSVLLGDASGLNMIGSRRLQLAARARRGEAGGMPTALLIRPAAEMGTLSAAHTRWRVMRVAVQDGGMRGAEGDGTSAGRWMDGRWTLGWRLELLRCKGLRQAGTPGCWTVCPDGMCQPTVRASATAREHEHDGRFGTDGRGGHDGRGVRAGAGAGDLAADAVDRRAASA
jgi:protein ImuA